MKIITDVRKLMIPTHIVDAENDITEIVDNLFRSGM